MNSTRRMPMVSRPLLCLAELLGFLLAVRSTTVLPRHCRGVAKHVHLAVGRDPMTQMSVSFSTKWARPGITAPLAGVLVGTDSNRLERFVEEQEFPLTYNTTLPERKWGHYYAPFQHHFTIDGLQPNTTYFFLPVVGRREDGIEALREKAENWKSQVSDFKPGRHGHATENVTAENQILSEEDMNAQEEDDFRRRLAPPPYDGHEKDCPHSKTVRSFRTAPETHKETPVSFAIVGDLGQFESSTYVVQHMKDHKDDYDLALLIGDIAYTSNDERRWETFFDFFEDYSCFDELPLMVATGNHDIEKQDDGREIFRAYEHRFRMPRVKAAILGLYDGPMGPMGMDHAPYPLPYDWGNAYYSFKYGSAFVIVVSAYSDMDPGSLQHGWLIEQLESVDRTETPWLIVSMHVPMYNTFDLHHKDMQIVAAREHVQPLLVKHKANMIFSGHIHAYQRTANIVENAVRHPHGPIHVTIGAGGRACDAPFMNATAETWIEQRDATMYGYGKFQIFNSTDAEWKWIPVAESDKHATNYLKHSDVELPSLKEDSVRVKNQYYLEDV